MRSGHLAFLLFLAGAFIWYAADVYAGARHLYDWLLILPAATVGVGLLLGIAAAEMRQRARQPAAPATGAPGPAAARGDGAALAFMALLVGYVAAIAYIGIDVATFAFLALALRLQGERSWGRLLVFALILSAGVTYVFTSLLSVSVKTLIL